MTEQKLSLADVASGLSRRASLPLRYSEDLVRSFFKTIEEGLVHDNIVKVKGFGTFKLVGVDARESINVNTGERIEIAGHTKVSFTPDAALRDAVNKPFLAFETVILNDATDIHELESVASEPAASAEKEVVLDVQEHPDEKERAAEEVVEEQKPLEIIEEESQTPDMPKIVPLMAEDPEEVSAQAAATPAQESEAEIPYATVEETSEEETPVPQHATEEQQETVMLEGDYSVHDTYDYQQPRQSRWAGLFMVLCALFFMALGYAICYYWQPLQLPDFNLGISKPVRIINVVPADSTVQDTVKTHANLAKPSIPNEAKSYPQVEGGEYWIVGVEGTEVMTPGKTLLNFSIKYYKTKDFVEYICKMNDITNPDIVPLNKELKIPKLQKK